MPGEEPGVPARPLQGAAICDAMQRQNMRFVPVKSEDPQARQMVHRARQGFITARTGCIDRFHRLLSEFSCGRQFLAWIGLVPGQYSTGGKARLGRITKAGDAYLRSLLVMGARAVLNAAKAKNDSLSRWAVALEQRRGYWKAVVAIAAKNARMAWAVLSKGESFKRPA